jgi:hypothetical protein
MAESLSRRIVVALKNGPVSRRELLNTFDYEPGLDAALVALSESGAARRFTNWPFYGGERVEYWTLNRHTDR